MSMTALEPERVPAREPEQVMTWGSELERVMDEAMGLEPERATARGQDWTIACFVAVLVPPD